MYLNLTAFGMKGFDSFLTKSARSVNRTDLTNIYNLLFQWTAEFNFVEKGFPAGGMIAIMSICTVSRTQRNS